jgi:hypothetical protein
LSALMAVTRPDGNVREIFSVGNSGVEVMNVTVAAPPDPTALLIVNADPASAITAPTAGVLTKAATVSLEVSIFKPVLGEDVDTVIAAWAARVRSEHITDTDPAATLPFKVMTILDDTNDEEEDTGDDVTHLSTLCETTRPDGNVRVILSPMTRMFEVVKVMVALWPGPTALVMVNTGILMH